jgi:ABC-type spermidine/putrescine transport system permease subunit I
MIAWYPVFGANGFLSSIYVSILTGLGYSNVQPVSLLFTNASVIITWIQSLLLFMVVPIYLMMLRMDPIVLKAASTLRASTLKTFYYITLQWSLPGILIGSVFVFSLAMVDYATPLLVGGGLPTIGVIIWQLGSYYEWPQAMALSTLVLAIILVFVAITLRKVSITRILY